MMRKLWIATFTSLLIGIIGSVLFYGQINPKFEQNQLINTYDLTELNSVLNYLKPIQKKHDDIINFISKFPTVETLQKKDLIQKFPENEFEFINLEGLSSDLENTLIKLNHLKVRADGKDHWAIGQDLQIKENNLEIRLNHLLKTDHRHLFISTVQKIRLPSTNIFLSSDFPHKNEFFVPLDRALTYNNQFLELRTDTAMAHNKFIQHFELNQTFLKIIFFSSIGLICFISLFSCWSYFSLLRRQKNYLKKGILKKENEFYEQFMDFKNEILQKERTITELKQSFHQSQTFKKESDSKVVALEKYKKELEYEKNRFEKISLEKVNLLSFVGHDLRAPLSNILSTSNILENKIPSNLNNHLHLIKKNAEDGLDLISGLLKSGGKKTGEKTFSIDLLIEECVSLCDDIANEKQITIIFSDSRTNINVSAQKLQIKQMLLNLIRNGIKYSPSKTTITISLKKHPVLPRNIVIQIIDQGPGIPKSELENIFKSYYRLNRDSEKEGSGVGLSFCRQICQQHGGNITAISDGEHGTTFEISLPIFVDPDKLDQTNFLTNNEPLASIAINDNEIILVEDNQETADIIKEKLKPISNSIHIYSNGDQFLRKLKLFPDLLKLTKVIVLDFEIPGTKGVDLINKISLFFGEQKIPIIFFSGNTDSIGTAAQMKADYVFNKKSDFHLLYDYINSLFDRGKAKNVLVVDDSEDIHYLLEIFFEDGPSNINATFVKNVPDAIKAIQENPDFWDVVLTDLNIGQESGVDLLKKLGKENLRGRSKIIAMSAMVDDKKRMELINIGFNEAISKNFNQAIINSILKY